MPSRVHVSTVRLPKASTMSDRQGWLVVRGIYSFGKEKEPLGHSPRWTNRSRRLTLFRIRSASKFDRQNLELTKVCSFSSSSFTFDSFGSDLNSKTTVRPSKMKKMKPKFMVHPRFFLLGTGWVKPNSYYSLGDCLFHVLGSLHVAKLVFTDWEHKENSHKSNPNS